MSQLADVPVARAVVADTGTPSPAITNASIGLILREIAQVLAMENESLYRARAYRTAAEVIEESIDPIATIALQSPDRLLELPGVGPAVARRIIEISRTGRLRELNEPQRREMVDTAQLMRVPGVGFSRARMLVRNRGIHTIADLADAAKAGKLRELPGFGSAIEARIARDADALLSARVRMLRPSAQRYGDALLRAAVRVDGVQRAALAGSLRRARDYIGQLRLVVSCPRTCEVLAHLVSLPLVGHVLAHDERRASVMLHTGIQATAHLVDDENFGLHLLFRTGSEEHVRSIRRHAASLGLSIAANGVFRARERVAGCDEDEVYAALGLAWIPPELREGRGEVDAARDGSLPRLLTLDAVRGDLQSHTTDSDGRNSLERMAAAAESLGYEYLAITDHSPALRIVRGLDREGYRRQWERIDALNGRLRGLTLLKGAEVDIAEDGALDLDEEARAGFDIVLVSMHSKFSLSREAQTRRLVRAVRQRYVDILAHPTGRILGRRPSADFDAHEVFRAAAENGVAIEVNGQPDRLDVDDVLCREALQHGCKIALGTDAHSVRDLDFMRWGVDQARRGWAEAENVLNTRSLAELRQLIGAKR